MNNGTILSLKAELEELYRRTGTVRTKFECLKLDTGNCNEFLKDVETLFEDTMLELRMFCD